MPRFSIVVPCYNAAFTISETIDSLRAQTEGDWEVLIIDDASYDDTRLAGGNVLGRWRRALSSTSEMAVQLYYSTLAIYAARES